MVTILSGLGAVELEAPPSAGGALWLDTEAVERATGWALKPEGLCRDALCTPVPPAVRERRSDGGRVDAAGLWRDLGRPVLASEAGDLWLLGEAAADRAAAMQGLQAPDFALTDLEGRTHRLSEHRGKKVLLATWASW